MRHIAAVLRNVYIDKLDEIVDNYSTTFDRKREMEAADVKLGTFIDYGVTHSDKNSKFKVGDHVWILKYGDIFEKWHTPNWCKKVFLVKSIKKPVPWTCAVSNLSGDKVVKKFNGKGLQRTNQNKIHDWKRNEVGRW